MYNLNLNLYVEQVNCDVDDSRPATWENNDEQALKDVVDPNTEFQVSENEGNLTPASPLESFGNPLPSQTRTLAIRKNNPVSVDKSFCDNFRSQTKTKLFEGLDVKYRRNNSDFEMPKVHSPIMSHPTELHRKGHDNGQLNDLEPKVHNEYIGKSSKYSPPHKEQSSGNQNIINKMPIFDKGYERQFDQHMCSTLPGFNHTASSEHLALAFKAARDRLETASNMSGCSSRFDLESNCSEHADSMSTFSDISGYEEELYRIRRLLLQDASSSFLEKHLSHDSKSVPKTHSSTSKTNNHVDNMDFKGSLEMLAENDSQKVHMLNTELQLALTEKEKFRLALNDAETKAALEWQQKYQEVLRQKANMEGRLEMVQSEVDSLRRALVNETKKAEANSDESELARIRAAMKDLSNKNQDLMIQLELSESEKNRWREETQESDVTNEQLRVQMQELRVDTESKDGAIQGLKMKVAEQHVEMQSLLQAKLKAENSMSTTRCEMETLQKSNQWYREQLHSCQDAKVKVHQELMTAQATVVSQSHMIERLKGEAENLKQTVVETQDRAVREKDSLLRKLEAIRADMLEREATIMGQLNRDDTAVETIAAKLRIIEENRTSETNIAIQDLEHQVDTLKHELDDKVARIESLRSENAQLLSRVCSTQESMSEKELALQNLEVKYTNVEALSNTLSENLIQKEAMILELKSDKVGFEVSLAAAAREKDEVDAAIVKLRDDFARISKSYQSMRMELTEKERLNNILESNIHELQKLKEERSEHVFTFKEMEQKLNEMTAKLSEASNWEHQVQDLHNHNNELSHKLVEIKEAKDAAIAENSILKETITCREEQLINQTQLYKVHSEELESRSELITTLTAEKTSLEQHIETLKTKIGQFEEKYSSTCQEVDSSNSQLARANFVIEQFNTLCKGSEQENYHLKKMVKELEETLQGPQQSPGLNIATQTNALNVNNIGIQVKNDIDLNTTKLKEENQEDKKEIEMLKCSLRMSDVEKSEKQRRYESNIRTLLKKVKEHMRGRKAAEKALEEARLSLNGLGLQGSAYTENTTTLQAEVKRLEEEKEVFRRQYGELKKVMQENEVTVLELEKEVGKLAQKQVVPTLSTNTEPESLTKVVKIAQDEQVGELEEKIRKQQIIIKELRKQIFVEKRNNSQLRKQVTSLRMGMDTANDVLDSKKVDLGRSEAMGELLREANSRLQRELEKEQIMHEKCKQDLDRVTQELEENLAKEPMLADQMKMLSYHLHQKNQETSNMNDMMVLMKNGWAVKEEHLKQNTEVLKGEINLLRDELTAVRNEKFTLQSQAVELKAGLQSIRDQNEILQLKIEAYQKGSNKDSELPDLMSSLPSVPVKYDELQIAELLNHSTLLPHNKPLSNLQSCLDSLKQEMVTLQQQVVAKTSGCSRNQIPATKDGIQEV